MSYKGNDLDLQTPRTLGGARPAPAPLERPANGSAPPLSTAEPGPIAVDDTVLACCNMAYDVARFHVSPDVKLEHLLHALTRVGPAVDVLAALGIRVDALRRETAVAIAAEMPGGPVEAHASPHASAAFEDVLRRAAEQAGRRHAPADLHDLIRTILGGGPTSPAAALLTGAADDPQRLERWRDAPLRAALSSAAPAAAPSPTPPLMPDISAALLSRLDLMEAALRTLQTQVAGDRQALGNLLRDVQAGLEVLQDHGAQMESGDRTNAVESLLETKFSDLDKSMGTLSKRLSGIDKIVAASEAWQELRTHLSAVEGRVGSQTLEVANRIADAFSERLQKTEAGLQRLQQETERHWSSNGERDIALEASVRSHLQGAEEAGKKHERDLGEVYQALVKLGANQQTLGDNFTAWRIETGGDIGIINNRLQQVEQTMLDLLGHLGNDLQALRNEVRGGGSGHNGFKRWLYGTGNVLAAIRRDEPAVAGKPAADVPKEADVAVVPKKS
jgi:hypothetical protein